MADVPYPLQLQSTTTGVAGAYLTGRDVEQVLTVRDITGRVTLSGTSGLSALRRCVARGEADGLDLDPAQYIQRRHSGQGELFPIDWEACQRDLGLRVVRSAGCYARRSDVDGLRRAFTTRVSAGATRLVSIDGWWLTPVGLHSLAPLVRGCDQRLALVLADPFDPIKHAGAADGLRELLTQALSDGRDIELLRSDVSAIAFAASGGAYGAYGLSTTTRHHGLPLGQRAGKAYEERRSSPYPFVEKLLSWQKLNDLAALEQWDGAGLTDCFCRECGGRSLLRFDHEYRGNVPESVRAEIRSHDLHCLSNLGSEILGANLPIIAWRDACRAAALTVARIASLHRVQLELPKSITQWT